MRGLAVTVVVLAAAVAVGATAAAPPVTAPWVDLGGEYQARAVGQRGVGLGQAADAGDVNGDGVPDELVWIPNGAGTVYVVYGQRGSSAASIDLDNLKASQGY